MQAKKTDHKSLFQLIRIIISWKKLPCTWCVSIRFVLVNAIFSKQSQSETLDCTNYAKMSMDNISQFRSLSLYPGSLKFSNYITSPKLLNLFLVGKKNKPTYFSCPFFHPFIKGVYVYFTHYGHAQCSKNFENIKNKFL